MSKVTELKPKSEYYQACYEIAKARVDNYNAHRDAGFTEEEAFNLVMIDAQVEFQEEEEVWEFTPDEQG